MKIGRLVTNNADDCSVSIFQASSMFERMRGLLGRKPLGENDGFWIAPCNSVHTWFMRYSIDVVFVNRSGEVKKIVGNLKPWSLAFCWRASAVLELRAGATERLGIHDGSCLQCEILLPGSYMESRV